MTEEEAKIAYLVGPHTRPGQSIAQGVQNILDELEACWRALALAHGEKAAGMVIQAENELRAMNEESDPADD